VAPTSSTNYTLKVRNAAGCVSTGSANVTISVRQSSYPAPTSISTTSSSTICETTTVSLSAVAYTGTTIAWYKGSTQVGTGTTLSYSISEATTFYAYSIGSTGCRGESKSLMFTKPTVRSQPGITTNGRSSTQGECQVSCCKDGYRGYYWNTTVQKCYCGDGV
jgi:hypothetical protein